MIAAMAAAAKPADSWLHITVYPFALASSVIAGIALLSAGLAPALVVALLGLAYAAFAFALERLIPETPSWTLEAGEVRADLLHALLSNTIPTQLFRVLYLTLWVAAAGELSAEFGLGLWPRDWPLLSQLVLALLTADFTSYAVHRGFHASRLFPLHAVHHCSPRMYFLLAARKHPIASFLAYGGRYSVLWLLGAPESAIALYTVVTAANSYLQHANVRVRTGWLRNIFVTPELHRVHHSRSGEDADRNFGDVLVLWDQLFGTLQAPHARRSEVGLVDLEVAQTYWTHLRLPFDWPRLIAASRATDESSASAASTH